MDVAKTSEKVRQLVSSIKQGRCVKTTNNVNAARAVKEANKLNKITGTDKFAAIAIGVGIGTGFIVSDVENIGTFGDWYYLDFLPSHSSIRSNIAFSNLLISTKIGKIIVSEGPGEIPNIHKPSDKSSPFSEYKYTSCTPVSPLRTKYSPVIKSFPLL